MTCFEAVAEALPKKRRAGRPLLVVLDAKRQDLYAQAFSREGKPEGGPFTATPEALAARLAEAAELPVLAGDGVDQLRPALDAAGLSPDTLSLPVDACAVARAAAGKPRPPEGAPPPAPLYLRPPDVSQPKVALAARQPGADGSKA